MGSRNTNLFKLFLPFSEDKEKGSGILISLGCGLVFFTIMLSSVMSGASRKVHVAIDEKSKQAEALAEAGITHYRAFLADNPDAAIYPDCTTSRDANGLCQDTLTDDSWSEADNIRGSSCLDNPIATHATTDWQMIDPSNPSKGEYRLVSYNYSPTVGIAPGTGTLTVEGRVNQSGNASTTRIEVNFPVTVTTSTSPEMLGLWINRNDLSNITKSIFQIQGNIQDSTETSNSDCTKVNKLKSYQDSAYKYQENPGKLFPSLPSAGQTPPTGTGVNPLTKIDSTMTLPQSGDTEVSDTYTYNLTDTGDSLKLEGEILTIDPGANKTVILYLPGKMIIKSGGAIIVNSGKLIIYAHDLVDFSGSSTSGPIQNNSGTADFVQLYNYSSEKVTLTGGSSMKLFVFAPNSLVEHKENRSIRGTIWAKNWAVASDSSFIQGDTNPANIPYTGPSNSIGQITSWKRRSVD